MSPQNRPRSLSDRLVTPAQIMCHARAAALEMLHDFSLPETCNVEAWLDRIEASHGREMRP